jgi:hypothetical protein
LHALTTAPSPNANTHVQRTRFKANLHDAAAGRSIRAWLRTAKCGRSARFTARRRSGGPRQGALRHRRSTRAR